MQREREKMLDFYATSIQKNLRRYAKRRHFLAMRRAAITVQKNWRAFTQRQKYKQVSLSIKRRPPEFRYLMEFSAYKQFFVLISSLIDTVCYARESSSSRRVVGYLAFLTDMLYLFRPAVVDFYCVHTSKTLQTDRK